MAQWWYSFFVGAALAAFGVIVLAILAVGGYLLYGFLSTPISNNPLL